MKPKTQKVRGETPLQFWKICLEQRTVAELEIDYYDDVSRMICVPFLDIEGSSKYG
jgi:hypothetical protein